jgi:hypothetical protein
VDHDFAPIYPDDDNHLEESGSPVRSEVERLVGVLSIIGGVDRVNDGVSDVFVIESVPGLVLPR